MLPAVTCTCSGIEYHSQIFIAPYATSKVNFQACFRCNLFQHFQVLNLFVLCPVKINKVQESNAIVLNLPGYLQRIFIVDLFCIEVSPGKADTFSTDNIKSQRLSS